MKLAGVVVELARSAPSAIDQQLALEAVGTPAMRTKRTLVSTLNTHENLGLLDCGGRVILHQSSIDHQADAPHTPVRIEHPYLRYPER